MAQQSANAARRWVRGGGEPEIALRITGNLYEVMVAAGYFVELMFTRLGLTGGGRHGWVADVGVSWNYATYVNIVFLLFTAVLVIRFLRTGGIPMVRMMGGSPDAKPDHDSLWPHPTEVAA